MKQYIVDAFTDTIFHGNQASKHGGTLHCRIEGDKVFLAGKAALFSTCELHIEI